MPKLLGDDRIPLAIFALMFGLAAANWPFLPWKRAHRVAAQSTHVLGPVLIGADILGLVHGFLTIGVGLLAWTVALTAYSYVQWRNDPDRT